MPARVETFEELVETARFYIRSISAFSSSSATSQRIFLTEHENDGIVCSYCLEVTGRKYKYLVDKCRRKAGTGELPANDCLSRKRTRHEEFHVPQRNVVCYRCNQEGHYCPNPSVPRTGRGNSGDRGGRGGYVFPGRGGRGGVNYAYYLWVPHNEGTSGNDSVSYSVSPSHPPLNLLSDEMYPFFSGVLHDRMILVDIRSSVTVILGFLTTTAELIVPLHDKCLLLWSLVYAANGAPINITGIGTAGTVLYLPDLQVNLFSQKQAIREGVIISLSSDGQVFTVTTADDRVMRFVFDGPFWKWNDMIPQSVSPAFVSSTSAQTPFPTLLPSPSMLAVTHTGAVHEFLLLHFRLGNLNYDEMTIKI